MLNFTLDRVEKGINELEEEYIQNETQKQIRIENIRKSVINRSSVKNIWNTCNGSTRGQDKGKRTQTIFKEIIAVIFPKNSENNEAAFSRSSKNVKQNNSI